MAQAIGMSEEVRELRARMKAFIDGVVFAAEAELERQSEHGLHPETGLPLELYEAAKARGEDTAKGVRGPGTESARRSTGPLAALKAEAKRRGLWALGHPQEIGGGGLPFMDFVYLNEIIGRSEYGQFAVGWLSSGLRPSAFARDAWRSRAARSLSAWRTAIRRR